MAGHVNEAAAVSAAKSRAVEDGQVHTRPAPPFRIESVAVKPFRVGPVGKWQLAALVLAIGGFVFLSGITSWPDQRRGMRRVNQQDEFYRYVAQELDEPSLCEEIPWSVKSPGGFFIAPSYERSNCYAFIAGRTKNLSLCWKVKRLGVFRLLSQQTSMWSCLANAWHGMHAGVGITPEELVDFFNRLGYDPDTIHLEGITPPVVNVKDYYRQLAQQPDIVKRIEKAMGDYGRSRSSTSDDSMNGAYLADIAALVTETAGWCDRIPEDLPLTGQKAGFHDWCLFTLASNTKHAELCRLIPIRAQERDPRLSLQATCVFQARSPSASGRYGPEAPNTDERTRALITMLHYEIPRAKDLPPGTVYVAYARFLEELNRGTDVRHTAARQRFIARVRALRRNGS
jgi:hypothetical protein